MRDIHGDTIMVSRGVIFSSRGYRGDRYAWVTVAEAGEDCAVMLTARQARKLAKRLKRIAREIEADS